MSMLTRSHDLLSAVCDQTMPVLRDPETKGILYIIVSGSSFVLMSAFMRSVTEQISILEASAMRSFLALPLLYALVKVTSPRAQGSIWTVPFFLRSLLGYTSFVCFVACLANMPLAVASALSYTAPIWSVLFSSLILRERVGLASAGPALLGFVGMLAIVQPAGGVPDHWIMVGLLGAALGSLAVTMVRRMSATETPERLALGFMLWSALIGLPPAVPHWIWPSPEVWLELALIAALATLAQVALTRGYALTPLAQGAPFDFVRLPASLIVGLAWFGEHPTPLMWGGTALIGIGSVIALIRRAPA